MVEARGKEWEREILKYGDSGVVYVEEVVGERPETRSDGPEASSDS